MGKSIKNFTDTQVNIIKEVAREQAINNGSNDNGLNIHITKADIKEETGRVRVQKTIIKKIATNFTNAGMEVTTNSNGSMDIHCPPLLAEKDTYTLKEIAERKSMINDFHTIEAYKNL
jgi:hypothetical protein